VKQRRLPSFVYSTVDRSQLGGDAAGPDRAKWSAGVKRLRLAAGVAILATLLISGCASGTATITGSLMGADEPIVVSVGASPATARGRPALADGAREVRVDREAEKLDDAGPHGAEGSTIGRQLLEQVRRAG
jgi:hypothetical protein